MSRAYNKRTVLKSDILTAQANTQTAIGAAQYLNLSYNTYKKWAKLYEVWKVAPKGFFKPKHRYRKSQAEINESLLKEILEGRRPNFNRFKLKSLIIKYGFLHEECDLCGFKEQRLTDRKVPLYLHFKDGNKKNYTFENLQLLCLNCVFLNIGDLRGHRVEYTYNKEQ